MASVHDAKANKLQVAWIGNKEIDIIPVDTTLEYTSARAFSGNMLITHDAVLSLLEDVAPDVQDFAKGSPNPIITAGWQADYAATFGNSPTIIIETSTAQGINAFNTLLPGAGGADGLYPNVPVTGGAGTGATANITIAGGAVADVQMAKPGQDYLLNDILSAVIGALAGFSIKVSGLGGNFIQQNWNITKLYDSTNALLQSFYIDDPDPDNANITAEAIRITIKK